MIEVGNVNGYSVSRLTPADVTDDLIRGITAIHRQTFSRYPFLVKTIDEDYTFNTMRDILHNPRGFVHIAVKDRRLVMAAACLPLTDIPDHTSKLYDSWLEEHGYTKDQFITHMFVFTQREGKRQGLSRIFYEDTDRLSREHGYVGRVARGLISEPTSLDPPEGYMNLSDFYIRKFGFERMPIEPMIGEWVDKGGHSPRPHLFEHILRWTPAE